MWGARWRGGAWRVNARRPATAVAARLGGPSQQPRCTTSRSLWPRRRPPHVGGGGGLERGQVVEPRRARGGSPPPRRRRRGGQGAERGDVGEGCGEGAGGRCGRELQERREARGKGGDGKLATAVSSSSSSFAVAHGRSSIWSATGFAYEDVDIEDDKIQGLLCIYSCPLKSYGPKWHNLTSSGCQISILRVRGSKWHLGTSSRAAGVFNSLTNVHAHLVMTIMIVPKECNHRRIAGYPELSK